MKTLTLLVVFSVILKISLAAAATSQCASEYRRINNYHTVSKAAADLGYGNGSCSLTTCLESYLSSSSSTSSSTTTTAIATTSSSSSFSSFSSSSSSVPFPSYRCSCSVSYREDDVDSYSFSCSSLGGVMCSVDVLSFNLTNSNSEIALDFKNYLYVCIPPASICSYSELVSEIAERHLLSNVLVKMTGTDAVYGAKGQLTVQVCANTNVNASASANANSNSLIVQKQVVDEGHLHTDVDLVIGVDGMRVHAANRSGVSENGTSSDKNVAGAPTVRISFSGAPAPIIASIFNFALACSVSLSAMC